MITTKYNFRKWMRKKYPDIVVESVYGTLSYILSKDLDEQDSITYGTAQLPNGKYIVHLSSIGSVGRDIGETKLKRYETMESLKSYESSVVPTTFQSFEKWIRRNNINVVNRTHCSQKSIKQLLFPTSTVFGKVEDTEDDKTSHIPDKQQLDRISNWYMYELEDIEESLLDSVPWTKHESVYVVLVKAGNRYVYKKQLITENYKEMQSLSEQIIVHCTKARLLSEIDEHDVYEEEIRQEWSIAKYVCEQYMGIQFEYEGTVDLKELQEAYNEGKITSFIRDRRNFTEKSNDCDSF